MARRGALAWRRAVGADIPSLSAFLEEDEERRVGFSGRLLREGPAAGASLRLPSPLRGAVWVAEPSEAESTGPSGPPSGPAISGAVLCHPSRLVFPIFPRDGSGGLDGDLALISSSFSPASAVGMARDVERYEFATGRRPKASVSYLLMTMPCPAPSLAPSAYPAASFRRATIADLDALLPLQEAYEREEVLTPIHEFNAAACRASLARALERQLVFAAEEGGVLIGKAGTNARGFRVDQIGGVYTLPARRGRGIATALMAALLGEILGQGRRPSLFVKPGNTAAMALYRALGFRAVDDYRADYFDA